MFKKVSKEDQDLELLIAESVIKELPQDKLIDAKKFLDKFSDHKRLEKLFNTYIVGTETALSNTNNGKIFVNYSLDGTVTGRLSNSGANISAGRKKESKIGISFHTMPREQIDFNLRDIIVAPEGHDFVTLDIKSAELRVLAHIANEKNMIKAFEDKIDLHTYSASEVFNKPKDKVSKEERQIAKEVSFLIVYGGTSFTLANKRNIPEHKAQKIIDGWMTLFPGVPNYMAVVEDYIKQHKYAKTIFGRRRNLSNIDSPVKNIQREAFRQGLNFTVQSPASDFLGCGIVGIDLEIKSRGLQAIIAGSVHDSISVTCPKSETELVCKIMKYQLEEYPYLKKHFGIYLKVPIEIEIKVGKSFGSGEIVEV